MIRLALGLFVAALALIGLGGALFGALTAKQGPAKEAVDRERFE